MVLCYDPAVKNTNMQRVTLDHKSFVVGEKQLFTESYSLDKGAGLGSYYFLLSIESDTDGAFGDIAYALNQSFKEIFLEENDDFFEVFESAITKVNEQYIQLMAEFNLDATRVDAVILAERQGDVMLTRSGLAEVYMAREGSLIDLSESIISDRKSKELFDNVISGRMQKNDTFIFTNQRLLRFVTENYILSKNDGLGVEDFVESLTDEISKSDPGKLIGVVISCKDIVYEVLENDNPSTFLSDAVKNFKRGFVTVLRSVLSGNVKSIDIDLRRKVLMFFVGLVILFMLTTLLLAYRSVVKSEEARFTDELQTAQLIVNNAKSEFDKEVVGRMLQNAEAKLNSIRGLEALEDEVQDVYDQIKDIRVKIDNVIWIDQPELEMKIFNAGDLGDSLLSVLGYDSLIYLVSNFEFLELVSGVKKEPISLELESNELRDVVWDKDGRALYLLTKDRGVKKVQSGLVSNLDVDNDSLSLADAAEFYADKLYLLDRENQEIWRHQVKRSGLGEARSYLFDGYGRYLQDAVDLTIDGYIYVLTDAGDIFRFLKGELDDRFKVASKPMIPLLNPTSIHTELDVPYIFVLEPSQNRIVQYYKDSKSSKLEYVLQYIISDIDDIRDISIDYQSKKIYLINSSSVYSIDLEDSLEI